MSQALAGSSWAQGSFAGTDLSAAGLAAKTVSHGLLGGALAHAQGGKFGHGFLSSGVTAASFYGIGTAFEHFANSHAWMQGSALGSELSAPALALKSVSHGLTGGILSQAQGGKFSHGFVSAGVTQLASGGIDTIDANAAHSPARIIVASMVGGTVSELTGGKFANGAVTGAFSRALNDEMHYRPGGSVISHTVCKMNCHGVGYGDRRYLTEAEQQYLDMITIAIDLAMPFPPIIAGSKALSSSKILLSKAKFGHTFSRHGSESTEFLSQRAAATGMPQGQFLDDQVAARFILDNIDQAKNGAISVPVPSGFPERIIHADGSYSTPSTIRLVPGGKGVKTAYPEP